MNEYKHSQRFIGTIKQMRNFFSQNSTLRSADEDYEKDTKLYFANEIILPIEITTDSKNYRQI